MAFHHHLTSSSFHFVCPVRNTCHFEEFYTYYKHFYTNKDDGIRSINTFVPLNVYLVFNDIYIYLHSFEYRLQFTIHFLKENNLYHIYNMIYTYIVTYSGIDIRSYPQQSLQSFTTFTAEIKTSTFSKHPIS